MKIGPLEIKRLRKNPPPDRSNFEQRSVVTDYTTGVGLPYSNIATPQGITASLQLSAVYRCVDVISDDIASQAIDIRRYDTQNGWFTDPFHRHNYMLNLEPNKGMNKFALIKAFVAKILLEGNGLIWIHRDGIGEPVSLELIDAPFRMFQRYDLSIFYIIDAGLNSLDGNRSFLVEGEDMIHVFKFSYNGFIGVSTLTYAMNATDLAYKSDITAAGFFGSGANMSGILEAEGKVDPVRAAKLKGAWAAAFTPASGGTPGGIAVMESGLKFTPVTVNPHDAQMLESRQFNVTEICRFFGVSPAKAFDDKNLTYTNIEAFELGYLTDTISPWDARIETEFNRKLFRPSLRSTTTIQLNIEGLLRANLDAKANYVSKLFQCGGYTTNEVRRHFTSMPILPDGDNACVQSSMIPLSKLLSIKPNGKPTDGTQGAS